MHSYDILNIEISRINLFRPNQEHAAAKISTPCPAIPVQSSNQLSYRVRSFKWLYFNPMTESSSDQLIYKYA